MPRCQRDGARGAAGQRSAAVDDAEAFGPGLAEVAAIERLGRLLREETMLAEAFEPRAIDLAGRGQGAAPVEALAGTACTPIVDRPIARSRVEGKQRAVAADPGDVGDATDIHQR